MKSQYGLDEVYSPRGNVRAAAHIIFVHGLSGHPRKSWTTTPKKRHSDPVFWPRDLLPTVTGDVKISTWGYDADIDSFATRSNRKSLFQHSMQLLNDIADMQAASRQAPIPLIFVAHSLGGIVVKDALNLSRQMVTDRRLGAIAPWVHGVCFLGTPHQGTRSASIGRIVWEMMRLAGRNPNTQLLRALEEGSETLDRIGSDFVQTLEYHRNLQVRTFCEEKDMQEFWVIHTMPAKPHSAALHNPREELGTIPADHAGIAKFESSADVGFRRISAQLHRWSDECRYA